MIDQKPRMFMPALIGGAVAGILSGVPFINCLCCIWIIGGAILSAYLLSKDSSVALSAGDGAIVGVFTGIIAAVVDFIVSIPFSAMSSEFTRNIMEKLADYAEEMPSGWENLLEKGGVERSIPMLMLGFVISVIIFSVLGALGGIIGISIFKKKTSQNNQGVIDVPKNTYNAEDTDNNQS